LLERTSLDASQRESLEVIKTSADALLGLLNGILDLSKIDAGRLQVDPAPVALKAELERLMGLFAPRAAEKACASRYTSAPTCRSRCSPTGR
jgi:signal transduction histidine kinase